MLPSLYLALITVAIPDYLEIREPGHFYHSGYIHQHAYLHTGEFTLNSKVILFHLQRLDICYLQASLDLK